MKPINVLSLFDGMSGGQIALERAGVPVANYFASEIDKYAIKVTQFHYRRTHQLGTVLDWESWRIPKIDFLFAGFPCQAYSNAGKGLGLEDLRGQLIYPMLKIIEHYRPTNFLLENVKGFTSKRHKAVYDFLINELKSFGYDVHTNIINSALVSAQNRERLYITSFPITQPEDKGILLKDIIEKGEVDREKSYTIAANYFKGGNPKSYFDKGRRQLVFTFKHQSEKRAMVTVKTIPHGYVSEKEEEADKYPSLCAQSPASKHLIRVGTADDIAGHDYNRRIYSPMGKSPTLNSGSGGNLEPKVAINEKHYRKLTPLECERLQTVQDGWVSSVVSNTQAYKCLGNGWTIDAIVHIIKCSPLNTSSCP
jgi:DNA-cytosine methyltransferase